MIVVRQAVVAAAVLAGLAVLVGAPALAAPAGTRVAFTVTDPRIDEASGLALGIRSPGVAYVQDDSGDTNRFFAVSRRSGATLATITVPGARNVDWEDVAVARDAAGTPRVWLADTGNNAGDRSELTVYRVPEPRVVAGGPAALTTPRADVWRVTLSGGVPDVESLAVLPGDGGAYLVTKALLGAAAVYALPAQPDPAAVRDLDPVAAVRFRATGTPGGPPELGPAGSLVATGAGVAPDGRLLAIRTYTDAYLWRLPPGARAADVAAVLRAGERTVVPLPRQPQGEGIAVTSTTLLVDSEGVGEPVYAVPIPRAALAGSDESPTRTPSPAAVSSAPASPGTPDDDATGSANLPFVIGAGVVIVLAGATYLVLHRRHRRR